MKLSELALCGLLLLVGAAIASPTGKLGEKRCTWGPQFWCSNITNAKSCNAVTHCIQTVWEKQNVPVDNDEICKICLDMVQQARDQLESNETQSDLKAVFEGSCKLIPIKPVQKECIKLADDFIPELVEALASQMNPQVVCSVAGLCNNAEIDKMLAAMQPKGAQIEEIWPVIENNEDNFTCDKCDKVAKMISNRFSTADRDDVLDNLLLYCGKFSSFSDACSNIILTYFNAIYEHLTANLNSENICHMSGVCADKFHQHPELVEIRPMSAVGVVPVKDDVPCELCEQLIKHLRDVLVANTTEIEFKEVLEGLCKQTHSFQAECLSIVDQYYDLIYKTLVDNLDENGVCFMIGICQKGLDNNRDSQTIMPLVPLTSAQEIYVTLRKISSPKKLLGEDEPKLTNEQIQNMQLPIDRLMGPPNSEYLVENGEVCTLCEYFLHFVQESLASPTNEDDIKHVVSETCNKLPKTISTECHNFVDMYGDAVIALLIQSIDPTEICPMLKMCPTKKSEDVEIFAPKPIDINIDIKSDKPTCPLCLFAVTEAQTSIKSDKSKQNIKKVLDNLCIHLPHKLQLECKDFVETYSSELIDLLINDFTPQQICVSLKLCTENNSPAETNNGFGDNSNDIMTNEIPDNTVNGQFVSNYKPAQYETTPVCLLCERVIKEVEKRIVDKKSKEQIKNALEHACDQIKKYKKKCHDFVEKHGDQIADLILKDLGPKEICHVLGYCILSSDDDLDMDDAISVSYVAYPSDQIKPNKMPSVQIEDLSSQPDIINSGPNCVLCEFIMSKLEQELADKKTQDEIKQAVENICSKLPSSISKSCTIFVEKYANAIISLVSTTPPEKICEQLKQCSAPPSPKEEQFVESKLDVLECAVCQTAIVYVDKLLANPDFDKRIENLMAETCKELPAKYYKKCSEMIEIYGQSMINLITAHTDPEKICAKIGMCFADEHSGFVQMKDELVPKRIEKPKLLGAEKCTWGPSHWCESQENAEKCHAVSFCSKSVWEGGKAPST